MIVLACGSPIIYQLGPRWQTTAHSHIHKSSPPPHLPPPIPPYLSHGLQTVAVKLSVVLRPPQHQLLHPGHEACEDRHSDLQQGRSPPPPPPPPQSQPPTLLIVNSAQLSTSPTSDLLLTTKYFSRILCSRKAVFYKFPVKFYSMSEWEPHTLQGS